MSPVLEARGLRAGYGAVEIVHGVDLTLAAGEMLTLIGPNGAGKSTLLKALAGAAGVMGGSVTLMGRDVTGTDAAGIAAAGAAYVPQERNIFRSLTVEENLGIGGWLAGHELARRRAQVLRLLPELDGFLRRIAGRLSGGERQTLAVGMALMVEPKVLLM
ncbi:MAG: ATP-binding cassette domain-containing protein, partial [Thermohalobaculum sp.]|nr:ATP-binding cassette domain-containing protein [Thermohalobaculum sp.]